MLDFILALTASVVGGIITYYVTKWLDKSE